MPNTPFYTISLGMVLSIISNAQANESNVVLDDLVVQLSKDAGKYVAIRPNSLKDRTKLYETAQSISVLTPQQVEQKQANTIAELLENISGVSSGVQGRRGWDDFIIRGQVSSAQTYVDGMRVQTSTNNLRAWDVGAADSIEVIKGPTTVGYGMSLPGGMVNITSKRPQDESFNQTTITLGNFNQKELSYDINHAPKQGSTKGAFRLNGRYADRDDATDHVYFKNYYVAPSYTFDLGDKANLTILGNYQWREYVRQQGLPHNNTINLTTNEQTVRNAHQKYPSTTFFGLPNNEDKQRTFRIGYDFAYQLNNLVKLKSIFAITKTNTRGNPTLASAYANFYQDGIIQRQVNTQDKHDMMYTMDNRIETWFDVGQTQHDVVAGVDLLKEHSDYIITRANANLAFNANTPDYTNTGTKAVKTTRNQLTQTQFVGAYLKDSIHVGNAIVGLAARHDWAKTTLNDRADGTISAKKDNVFTGNASVMYDYQGKLAPYISYSTSFQQNNDLGLDGNIVDAEQGKQTEVGMKFQGWDSRLQGYIAYYDLIRHNIAEPIYDDKGIATKFSQLVGKQRTKGLEMEATLVLNNQWNISGSYSYIPVAKITHAAIPSNINQRISQIPKNAASFSTQYYFHPDRLGFYVGGGARHQGERRAWRSIINNRGIETTHAIDLPSYTLFDLKAGYEAKNWGMDVAVKNILNQDYLIGTTPNAQLVSYGEPRNIRVAVKLKY